MFPNKIRILKGYSLVGALPSDYLSTDESDDICNVEAPMKTVETETKDESTPTEGESESTEPMIGQITFVSCATGSEDTNSLPPVFSNSPSHTSQDNINSGNLMALLCTINVSQYCSYNNYEITKKHML